MITRIAVRGYKSLRDVKVEFRERQPIIVIMGPNAAGKSNLLDLLGLVSRMATEETLVKAFTGHRGGQLEAFSFGPQGIEGLGSTQEFEVEIDVRLSRHVIENVERTILRMRAPPSDSVSSSPESQKKRIQTDFLRYKLRVRADTEVPFLSVAEEQLVPLTRDGHPSKKRQPFVEKINRRLRLRMEGQSRPTEYETGLPYTLVSRPLYPPHYPHIAAFKEELARWRFYYLEPSIMRQPAPAAAVNSLGPFGADLASFFNSLKHTNQLQFEAISQALRLLVPAVDHVDVKLLPEGKIQLFVREHGVTYSAEVISEGTLRVLGLLAVTNPLGPLAVVGYEEPENGVHPRRLSLISKVFREAAEKGDTQYILTTHSILFPQYFRASEILVCKRTEAGTRFEPFKTEELLKPVDIEQALADMEEEPSFATRVRRGDFGG